MRALLAYGFRRIVIAIADGEPDLHAYAVGPAMELAEAGGAQLDVFIEKSPLGNIGAVGPIRLRYRGSPDFLVVFVDNLTTVDLTAFTERHTNSKAALTIATHIQEVPMPFGVLRVRDNLVADYLEKPVRRFRIASGIFCISSQACELLPTGTRVEISQFFALLRDRGELIVSYQHDRPWIDVNDAATLAQAERLVGAHAEEFAV